MGTIACTVDGSNKKLTFHSITGFNPSTTWVRFKGAFFEISGGGSFVFELTTPDSSFRIDTSGPVDWNGSQPSWITIQQQFTTATLLRLQADTGANDTKTFTILNAMPGGESITLTVASGAGGGGTGGTIAVYLGAQQKILIGELPDGALAKGSQVDFGYRETGVQQLLLSPGEETVIRGVVWHPSLPDYIEVLQTAGQVAISIDNPNPAARQAATFAIETNHGPIDPTIITNPDESGP